MRSQRGVSSKTIAVVLVLMVALVAAGVSCYNAFFRERAKPTGVDEAKSLPEGHLAPPESIGHVGQGERPRGDDQ